MDDTSYKGASLSAKELLSCLQLIEPDRLSNPNFQQNNEFLRDGIEINKYGEAKNYWISEPA